ncbi:MAG: hypothetical protein GWO24_08185, partial [Akkermansiaceae bacterium]|nr:hypothetical protein [Akkermansiaceae bacterium]
LFPSILYPGDHFEGEGLAAPIPGRLTAINLPVKLRDGPGKDTASGEQLEKARELV